MIRINDKETRKAKSKLITIVTEVLILMRDNNHITQDQLKRICDIIKEK